MLRVSLTRPLIARHFSSTSSIWNTAHTRPSSELPESTDRKADSSSAASPLDAEQKPSKHLLESYDLDVIKQHLRDWTNQAALSFRARADDFTAKSKTTFSHLGSQLNKVTGYEAIEALKRDVVEQEERITAARQAAREAKQAYDEAVAQRSNSQREVNDLLQRKSIWTDSDVSRFTTLVRQDHLYEQEEARAKAAVHETESAVEREFSQLMRTILARYHEEQVWSDKIRSASTYGSLAALGLNMLVFVMAILVVEPWKRRRLAQTFEKKIEELSRENEAKISASMTEIGTQLAGQERLILQLSKISQSLVDAAPVVKDVAQEMEVVDEPQQTEDVGTERTIRTVEFKRSTLELAAIGTSAFVAGVLSCLWLGR
ncbi:putative required for the maintenance of the structure of the mitochondrial inner membrane [Lyophyllum shimeji]|uniref:Sensitive to high expression protein 9, mitochondrial n=1 Tax=Lyophyllum shimeji TaxID=47721 RepID=A0A9P3PMQ2_LYOSH|nr:putative required for the maintenance of the structure of the mitochondrial inner membrane [Lyophyllum shimeji]